MEELKKIKNMMEQKKEIDVLIRKEEAKLAYEIYENCGSGSLTKFLKSIGAEEDERYLRTLYTWAIIHRELLCDDSQDTTDKSKAESCIKYFRRLKKEKYDEFKEIYLSAKSTQDIRKKLDLR